MAKRTTHRSSAGKKLYAVRDAKGRITDIQTFERAHRADLAKKSKDEEGGGKKAAKKGRKKAAKKAATQKAGRKKAGRKKAGKRKVKKTSKA